MIDVLADDERSAFGVGAALDVERVPWRRIRRVEDFDARALVVSARELGESASAFLSRIPAVVFGVPRGPLAARLGGGPLSFAEAPVRVSLDGPVLAPDVRAQVTRLGIRELRLPRAPLWAPAARVPGRVLAVAQRGDGAPQPAIVAADTTLTWSLVDLGTALADLMDEGYRPAAPAAAPIPSLVLGAYYRAPEALRRLVQRRAYRGLEAALSALGDRASEYPVDAGGWLCMAMILGLVRRAAGGLVRLARWPAPWQAAAALTHDLEPTRFAYRRGLRRLLECVATSAHPATFGVVARPGARHLGPNGVRALGPHEVICHGLEHRGETIVGTRDQVCRGVAEARRRVEVTLGRPVAGFRSPRLDRSRDLLWALDRAGLAFDSSWPDVDRENLQGYGTGVRLNVPFRPPVADDGGQPRPSRCLEIPVSAPDCIQPLFEGASHAALRRAVRQKLSFLRATGGVYVGIVHAGVFGVADADRREDHLRFVVRQVRRAGFWLASLREIAEWWQARERVAVVARGERVLLHNRGEHTIGGLRLLLERDGLTHTLTVPPLPPGGEIDLEPRAPHPHAAAG